MGKLTEYETPIIEYDKFKVYQSDIDILCDEYIDDLPIPDQIYSKAAPFNGLLLYLYQKRFGRIINANREYANSKYDFQLLDNIFHKVYLPLCYKYSKTPTVSSFCNFCNMSYENISNIKQGIYQSCGSKTNNISTSIAKKWYEICECSLINKTVEESSIGSMFILKAVHGYRDNDNTVFVQPLEVKTETPEQIAAKYSTAEQPELPDFSAD